MSKFKKRVNSLHDRRFVGVVLKPEQRVELDALASDMDVEPGQVLAVGLWLLSKVGRSGRDMAVYTAWNGGRDV